MTSPLPQPLPLPAPRSGTSPRLCVVRPLPRYEPEPDGTPPSGPPSLRLVPDLPAPLPPPRPVGVVPPRADEALERAAQHVVRTVLEVVNRRRPAAHLRAVVAPDLHDRVASALLAAHRNAPHPTVSRRVHVQAVAPGVAEVFGLVTRGPRGGLLAGRIELRGGRWLATAWRLA